MRFKLTNRIIKACLFSLYLCFSGYSFAYKAGDVEAIQVSVSQGFLQSSDNNYLANTDEGTFQFNENGYQFWYKSG